jgi:uncharacterized protein YndB with AHSA1/START domain
MTPIAVERTIWIDAPCEKVWQAISDPSQIIQWFLPNLPGAQMTRTSESKIAVQLGPMSVDFMVVEKVVELEQFTFRTLPDRIITTTYMLEDENDGTRVSVKASGFEALSDNVQEERLKLSGANWEKVLKNLNAFVMAEALPNPQAFVGPLFGYWRETKTTLAAERSIWINCPPERVWKAITDPKQLQMWFSPTTQWKLSALELGGRLYVQDAETGTEKYVEIIEVLDPPYRLATRHVPEGPSTVVKGKTYTLKEENGGTRLTVTLSGYEQEPEESRWNDMEQNTFGFGMMLQNTKAYLEGQELPFPFGF